MVTAILSVIGRLIASGIGALIDGKISKSKLNHQSLNTNEKTK